MAIAHETESTHITMNFSLWCNHMLINNVVFHGYFSFQLIINIGDFLQFHTDLDYFIKLTDMMYFNLHQVGLDL